MITSGLIKTIQDIMRKDEGVDGDAQRLSQLVWLIFLKVLDDNEKQKEFLDSNYTPSIPTKYQWRNWAAGDDGLTGDALLKFINDDLFPTLSTLPATSNKRADIVRQAFGGSYNYMKNGTLLRQVINKINEVDFNATSDRHTFNDIYENLLASLQSAGNAGEYYTPRPVTKFIVDMVDPKLGEKVFDPACGTGGFLSNAIEHMRLGAKTPEDLKLLEDSIYGVEKKQLPYLLCTTNMILHGLEEPYNIRHDNTLRKPLTSYGPADYVDCITANPPFGGKEEDGIEDNFPSWGRTRETADLFLQLFVRLLKPGGRAGIVLPDGTLFGEGVKTRIKQHLLEECNLHTIVRLPESVFSPYTKIATNLLFFTKGEPTKEIWYYEHRLPEGVKAYNKTKPIRNEEFDTIKDWWDDRKETDVAWKVSIDEIKKRGYNLDIKNPNTVAIDELNPEEVLAAYRSKWQEVDEIADRLQEQLNETLDRHDNQNIHFLTKNLHEYLHVPNATKLLRKTILHLAVSGQLVSQDPSEGTGEELYQQIQTEKAKLMSEGKLKKQKALPEISETEIPFEIPKSWKWVRLADATIFSIGRTPARKDNTYWDEKYIPWVSIADLQAGQHIITTKEKVSKKAFDKCFNGKAVSAGSLLYSFKLTIGKMSIIDMDAVHNEAIASFETTSKELTAYLFKALEVIDPTQRSNSAVMGKTLNSSSLSLLEIPLPPLSEQTRIVQKTTQLLDLVTELEKYLEK